MVSVIVPVYKSEKTLERCVNSLLEQDYKDIEILLVVDGPPDGSGILAERLATQDSRIRVINQANQGVSKARNRGIAEAHGEYIRFLDSDDYVEKDAIAPMVKQMEQDESDLVIAGYHHLYFGDCITKVPKEEGTFFVRENIEKMIDLYRGGFLNMPWNKLLRREKIVGEFPTDMELGEDLLFNLQYITECDKISVLRTCVCEYIQDDRGTTLSTKKRNDKIETALYLYEKSKEFFVKIAGRENMEIGFLDEKVITTFLDEVELTAFAEGTLKEKRQMIKSYARATGEFLAREDVSGVTPKKADYKIVYFFLKRNMIFMTMLMVWLRMLVVKMVRRRRM